MSGSVEEWLTQMREQTDGGLVARVIAMRDRRSGDALFEVTDETDLGILAAKIDAMYLNAGVSKYDSGRLTIRMRFSLRFGSTRPSPSIIPAHHALQTTASAFGAFWSRGSLSSCSKPCSNPTSYCCANWRPPVAAGSFEPPLSPKCLSHTTSDGCSERDARASRSVGSHANDDITGSAFGPPRETPVSDHHPPNQTPVVP
jgi:hypothetical protein